MSATATAAKDTRKMSYDVEIAEEKKEEEVQPDIEAMLIAVMEEISRAYDEMLAKEAAENPPEIGYCGFPCDGRCQTCSSGFDLADEV
jgi:hypothetical protein